MTPRSARLRRLTLASCAAGSLVLGGCAGAGSDQAAPVTSTVVVTSTMQLETAGDASAAPSAAPSAGTAAPESTVPAGSTGASTSETPAGGPCEVNAIQQVSGYEEMDMMMYCDGTWARAALYQSDWLQVFTWTGSEWSPYLAHGETRGLGMARGCYLQNEVAADGVPAELVEGMTICREGDHIF